MIIGGKRACGKSTELIKISYTNNIPIIVLNSKRAEELEYIAKKEGIKIPKPIIYKNYKNDVVGKRINEILLAFGNLFAAIVFFKLLEGSE